MEKIQAQAGRASYLAFGSEKKTGHGYDPKKLIITTRWRTPGARSTSSSGRIEGQSLMRAAMTQLNLSARAYHRILKLARTIADLAAYEDIQSAHLAEALQYQRKLMLG